MFASLRGEVWCAYYVVNIDINEVIILDSIIATNTLFITADSLWLCWTADLIPLWWVDRILHNGGNVLILPAPPTHGLPSALLASTYYQLSSLGPRRCPGRESNESKQSWRNVWQACLHLQHNGMLKQSAKSSSLQLSSLTSVVQGTVWWESQIRSRVVQGGGMAGCRIRRSLRWN